MRHKYCFPLPNQVSDYLENIFDEHRSIIQFNQINFKQSKTLFTIIIIFKSIITIVFCFKLFLFVNILTLVNRMIV